MEFTDRRKQVYRNRNKEFNKLVRLAKYWYDDEEGVRHINDPSVVQMISWVLMVAVASLFCVGFLAPWKWADLVITCISVVAATFLAYIAWEIRKDDAWPIDRWMKRHFMIYVGLATIFLIRLHL